jgi:hypothetical protein
MNRWTGCGAVALSIIMFLAGCSPTHTQSFLLAPGVSTRVSPRDNCVVNPQAVRRQASICFTVPPPPPPPPTGPTIGEQATGSSCCSDSYEIGTNNWPGIGTGAAHPDGGGYGEGESYARETYTDDEQSGWQTAGITLVGDPTSALAAQVKIGLQKDAARIAAANGSYAATFGKRLARHARDHAADFGIAPTDSAAYARSAYLFFKFAALSSSLYQFKWDLSDGALRIYDPINNIFESVDTVTGKEGLVRTYFKPQNGAAYWQGQDGVIIALPSVKP